LIRSSGIGNVQSRRLPPKSNRKGSFVFSAIRYHYRNLVERFFKRLKQCRGIATQYDKNPENFLAAIKLVSARIWIHRYVSASENSPPPLPSLSAITAPGGELVIDHCLGVRSLALKTGPNQCTPKSGL